MTDAVKVGFVPFSAAPRGILVVFCDDTMQFGAATRKTLGTAVSLVKRAAETNQFKGKSAAALDILAPEGLKVKRLIVMGVGKLTEIKDNDFLKLGGVAAGKLRAGNDEVTIIAELPDGAMKPDQTAAVASGVRLRAVSRHGGHGVLQAVSAPVWPYIQYEVFPQPRIILNKKTVVNTIRLYFDTVGQWAD